VASLLGGVTPIIPMIRTGTSSRPLHWSSLWRYSTQPGGWRYVNGADN
jgi:hypothetical protein